MGSSGFGAAVFCEVGDQEHTLVFLCLSSLSFITFWSSAVATQGYC